MSSAYWGPALRRPRSSVDLGAYAGPFAGTAAAQPASGRVNAVFIVAPVVLVDADLLWGWLVVHASVSASLISRVVQLSSSAHMTMTESASSFPRRATNPRCGVSARARGISTAARS